MAFRVVTIEHLAEVHARSGQLQVIQDQGTASIPLEDIAMLIADAPNIRLSTMCLCELSAHHIMGCHDGEKPSPLHPNHPDGCQHETVPRHGSAGGHVRSVQGPTVEAGGCLEDREPGEGAVHPWARRRRGGVELLAWRLPW